MRSIDVVTSEQLDELYLVRLHSLTTLITETSLCYQLVRLHVGVLYIERIRKWSSYYPVCPISSLSQRFLKWAISPHVGDFNHEGVMEICLIAAGRMETNGS